MTTSLDSCMKQISDALENAGVAEGTVVVFISDHGDMLGAQGCRPKQRPYPTEDAGEEE